MEFMNRGVRQPQAGGPVESELNPHAPKINRTPNSSVGPKGLRIAQVGLLACIAVLIVAAAVLTATSDNDGNKNTAVAAESRFIDTKKMQAVFLNNGQVYFGKIGDLNKDYLSMTEIYYLRVNQQVQPGQQSNPNDVSLAKLGCELHGPDDRMVINRAQVVFWENLKTDGQVADAVAKDKQAKKDNPDLAKCQTPQAGTNAPDATSTKPATPTTPAPSSGGTNRNP